jgi:hypothetical protein
MPDSALQGTDPLADIDPQMRAPDPNAPTGTDPFADMNLPPLAPERTTGLGAFFSHAARGTLPSIGGFAAAAAGAEAGAEVGGAIGAFGGPGIAGIGAGIGGFLGGAAAFFGGSYATEGAQDFAIHAVPDNWQDALGQSERIQRLQEQQHPYSSFIGGAAPYLLTMMPGAFTTKALELPENATAFDRLMANPLTNRLFGGAAMGGMELGQEEWHGETPDWAKIAISTGLGVILNKPTRFGEYLTGLGAAPVYEAFRPLRNMAAGIAMLRAPMALPRVGFPIEAIPPEGVLDPSRPTVARAADVGVLGFGITESTFQGGHEQSEATRAAAQNAAADEQAALGAQPPPDLDGIARRMEPELFARNEELLARRDSLRQFIDAQSNPPEEAFDDLADRRAMAEAALGYANPRSPDAARMRAELAGIEAEGARLSALRDAWASGAHVETPEITMARQHLLDTEHALWDLGPDIAAARRRAADHAGQVEKPGGPQTVAQYVDDYIAGKGRDDPAYEQFAANNAAAIEAEFQRRRAAEPMPPEVAATAAAAAAAPPEPPFDIIADRAAQLMAAGMSREQAITNATVEAHYYETLARRFGGRLGTAADLYRARAAEVRGPGVGREGAPPPAAPAEILAASRPAAEAPDAAPPPPAPTERPRIRNNLEIGKALGFPQADLQHLQAGGKLTPAKERKISEEQFKDAEALQAWQVANPRPQRVRRNGPLEVPALPEAKAEPVAPPILKPTPEAPNVPEHTPESGSGGLESLDPMTIGEDAAALQFKAGADEHGVTERLQGVEKWDPRMAGTVLVFRDADGKNWIADGHQRLALAKRMIAAGQTGIRLNAFVLDAKDGMTVARARNIAAAKNIAEGTGTVIDAAKIMRESAETGIELPAMPPRSALVRDGRALQRLGPDAFGMASNEVLPIPQSALVGRLVADPAQQVEAMRLLAKAKPDNLRQAEMIVRDMLETGTEDATRQGGLFGEEHFAASAVLERAKIADEAMRQLTRDRTTFRTLVGEAERIQGHGENVLDAAANQGRLTADEQAKQLLTQLATRRGPVSDALTGIARRLRDGDISAAAGAREFLEIVRAHVSGGLDEGPNAGGAVTGAERELAQEEPKPAEDEGPTLFQGPAQGKIRLGQARSIITLMRDADASTFMHETAHDWLEQLMRDAQHPLAPDQLRADADTVRKWLKLRGDTIPRAAHERYARTFEQYLREGVAPSPALASVFAKFKAWLTRIYQTIKGLGAPISEDIRAVFDRQLAFEPKRTTYAPEREPQPSLATIHEADAAETEPQEAGAVADRLASERGCNAPPPDIAHEIAAAAPASAETTQPAGEDGSGAGGRGQVDAGGGQSEPVAKGGGVGAEHGPQREGGGAAPAEGAGVRGGPEQRRGAGAGAGSEQLAPRPADTFPDAEPKLVDLAGNIRVENLTDQEDIAQAIHDSADRNDEFRAVRGGMTKGQMLDLAEAMGLDPSKIDEAMLGRMFGGTQELGAKILAARRLVVQSAGIVSDAMKVAAESGADADVGKLGVAIARHDMIQSALAGVTAEWGRAGNAFHSLLHGWEKAQDLNQLLRDNLGRDLFQLKMIAKMGARLDTPGKISKYLRDAQSRSFGRMILEYWINGLISGFSTHVTYMVGNAILAAEKAGPETAAAWAIGALRSAAGRDGARVQLGEVGAQFRGALREMPAAVQAALEAYRSGATTLLPGETARPAIPFQGDTSLTVARNMTNAHVTWGEVKGDAYALIQGMRDGLVATGELIKAGGVEGAPSFAWVHMPGSQIPNALVHGINVPVGTLARLPSRNVAAIHSTFRALNYSMEINRLAYRQAASEGLAGTDLAQRTADLRQNPTEEMMAQARGQATELTLMGEAGKWVKKLSEWVNTPINLPILGETPVLKFVDPFVHIASQIMNQSLVQRTPVGLLSSEIRADLMGRNGNIAQDTAAAKMLVGSVIATAFGGLAAQGLMSGSGPADPRKAAMWRLAGNQAHSARIGDFWYDIHRLGPMGMLASVAADMYDVAHQIGKEDADVVGKSLMHAFAQNILDESFMRGPADLIKAVTDPDRYGSGYVRTFLASFLPYSVGLAQTARATDPYSRQASTIMDTIRQKTPGLSESLFPRRDIWGAPMPSGDALLAPGITAIYAQRMSRDPVNLAMVQLGMGPAQVERQIRNVPLTDEQYDDFVRVAGVSTKMRLDAIVRSPDWQLWPDATKRDLVEEVFRQSREAARGWMMMMYPQIPRDAAQRQIAKARGEAVE